VDLQPPLVRRLFEPDRQSADRTGRIFVSETTEQPVSTTTAARARRGEGLSGMVLTDLKALAGQLGIKGTSGLRKGDLVSAIAAHQKSTPQSSAPAAAARRTAAAGTAGSTGTTRRSSGDEPSGPDTASGAPAPAANSTSNGSSDNTLALDLDLPQRPARRAAGRAEGAPAIQTDTTPNGVAATTASSTAVPAEAAAAARTDHAPSESGTGGQVGSTDNAVDNSPADGSGSERRDRQSYDSEDGPRTSRRNRRNRRDRDGRVSEPNGDGQTGQATADAAAGRDAPSAPSRDGQSRDGQNRDGQNRDGQNRDGQNPRNNGRDNARDGSRDNRQDGNRQDGNRQDANRSDGNRADGRDGEDQDGRRGRRFRDRNRRTRDRFADAPTDTEVRDDDVLVPVAGIVDVLDSYAFIRTSGYLSGPNDVYVSLSQIRKNGLRRGDAVTGAVRAPRDGEGATRQKFNALVRLDAVNGQDPELAKDRPEFTKLTPLYPNERLRLETESHILTTRIIDLVMPVGKGQRALIVSPPKAGKTSILQAVANAITTNNPEVHLMVVLVDERPEEVTDMQRSVKGEVVASTFDRPPADHTMVAELSIERAKRLVEMGRDVVVLLDSITRLGRAYNLAAPASGRILSGGVDSTALFPPKRFLGAARNIEHGGSLTIFASALVETGSAGDTVIFEEFKGTGNAELRLDRRIADKRIFPAIDVDQSSTRKEDLLLSPDELAITVKLRRVLSALDSQQALELLLDRLRKTKSNVEFLMQVAKTTTGVGND